MGLFTQQQKKKPLFNIKVVICLFFAFIMISSILAIWQGSTETSYSYGDYDFSLEGNYYTTKVAGKKVYFHVLPEVVSNIVVPVEIVQSLHDAPLWTIAFAPDDSLLNAIELVRSEFVLQDKKGIGKEIVFAIANDNSTDDSEKTDVTAAYKAFPTITCTDTQKGIVVLRTGVTMQTLQEDNCIIFEGTSPEELVLVKDAVLYHYYGIIE